MLLSGPNARPATSGFSPTSLLVIPISQFPNNPATQPHTYPDIWQLKGPYYANVQVNISILCLYMSPCFNVQKALYFSHTACAAAPLFTLCLKPEPSLSDWLAVRLCDEWSTA